MLRSYCKQDALVVALDGELDHFCAQSIRRQLDEMLADPSVRYLVLDFDKLTFMELLRHRRYLGPLPHPAGPGRQNGRMPYESPHRPDLSHVRDGSYHSRAGPGIRRNAL